MKQKIAAISWLVFSVIYLSSAFADTNQSVAETNQNKPEKPHIVTFEDNDKFKTVGSPRLSKDGKLIAYTLDKQIWIMPIEGGEPYAVTTKGSSAWSPVWTPDGEGLSFLSNRSKGHTQVWVLKFGHFGEAQQITELKRSANSIKWSPHGNKLLFVFRDEETKEKDPNTPKDTDDKSEKPWVVDRLEFKADRAEGYLTDQHRNHIYVYDIAQEELTQITSGDCDESQPCWSPDGKTVAFVSNRTENPDRNYNTDIWLVPADNTNEGQKLTKLTTHPGPDNSPVWSPDGKWIAYRTASDGEYGVGHLAIVPSEGGPSKILTKDLDRGVSQIEFSEDGESIYFIYNDSGSQHLGTIAVQGGEVKRLITGPQVVGSYSLGKNKTLATNITPVN